VNVKVALLSISLIIAGSVLATPSYAQGLEDRVNEAFRGVFTRNPTRVENDYWRGRVVRGEKTTFEALRGAMFYHRALGKTIGDGTVPSSTPSSVGTGLLKGLATTDDKTTLIKNTLPIFTRIYGNDPSNAEKAWWRKRIACGELSTHKALIGSMQFHRAKNARQGSSGICGGVATAATLGGGIVRKAIAGISSHPFGDQVRIGIFNTDGRAIHVAADTNFQVRQGQSKILATLGKDDVVQISWSDGKYHVRGSGSNFDTTEVIRLVPLDQGIMQIKSYSDKSTTIPGKNYNRFRGIIEIRKCDGCGELWAINELRTEYYLRGLAESSDSGPEEYIKALGAAARTYVLYHKVVTGGRQPKKGYDIGRTPDDQIYRGYEYEIITPRLASIFNQTKGIIVTDSQADKPVSTVYFSDSDGRTRSAREQWGASQFPHLQHSVADPHHVASTCVGHCVGMSAQGAFGFAKADGWSFQKILKYFYKSVQLVKAY
jgi:peptidoglycan hydrolase-like amidase